MVSGTNKKGGIPRPMGHLKAAGRLYPRAWKMVDQFRAGRGRDLPKWPSWCFMPMAGWYAIISADFGGGKIPVNTGMDIGRLAGIGTWRYSQGIYRFDPDIYSALWDTPIAGDIPAEVLLRLPEWCMYIETPGGEWAGQPLYGFFVHLEWDANDHRHELRLLLDTEQLLLPFPVHLGEWPLLSAVQRAINESSRHIPMGTMVELPSTSDVEQLSSTLAPMISLVLYLCSDEPDFGPKKKPQRPKPKRTKKGWRLFTPPIPMIWNVGERIGKTIRDAHLHTYERAGNRTVRPHLRRGHWHGYWTGPRTEEQRFRYHWVMPMMVGDKNGSGKEETTLE